jgi:hypothetical protein
MACTPLTERHCIGADRRPPHEANLQDQSTR